MKKLLLSTATGALLAGTLGITVPGAQAVAPQGGGFDNASSGQGRATLAEAVQVVDKAFRRWYVSEIRRTGNRPSAQTVDAQSSRTQQLYPEHGFVLRTNMSWELNPTSDTRQFRLCVARDARDSSDHDGLLAGVYRAGMVRAGDDECRTAATLQVPTAYPARVQAYRLLDLRGIAVPTMLPTVPRFTNLMPRSSLPSAVLRAPAGQWGMPFTIALQLPDLQELQAMGLSAQGASTQFGRSVPNYSEKVMLDDLSLLAPEDFRVGHDCQVMEAGKSCQIQVAFRGRTDPAEARLAVHDALRLQFSNGAVAFIGLQGLTDRNALVDFGGKPGGGNGGGSESGKGSGGTDKPATPGSSGEIPVKDNPGIDPWLTLNAAAGKTVSQTVTFRNVTGQVLRLNHYPSGNIGYPFTVQPQSDCPALHADFLPNATCTLKITFAPPGDAAGGRVYSDTANVQLHWQYKSCVVGACNAPSAPGSWAGPVSLKGIVDKPAASTGAAIAIKEGTSLVLGTLSRGKTYNFTLTLNNMGTNALAVFSFNSTGRNGAWADAQGSISQLDVGRCGDVPGQGSCTMSFTVTPGSWMTPGETRGILFQANGQDRVSYQPVTTPSVQITYVVGK